MRCIRQNPDTIALDKKGASEISDGSEQDVGWNPMQRAHGLTK